MSRITIAGSIISEFQKVNTLLDVGCREGLLRKHIPKKIEYYGADLFPVGEHVTYMGDFLETDYGRSFDAVTAIDVLEHMEHPSLAFDKLVSLTEKYLVVALPNCYDLKSQYKFLMKGHLGGKYSFKADEPIDRHRWIMNADEIESFFKDKARKHRLSLALHKVKYGGNKELRSRVGSGLSRVLPRSLGVETIIGSFKVEESQKNDGSVA